MQLILLTWRNLICNLSLTGSFLRIPVMYRLVIVTLLLLLQGCEQQTAVNTVIDKKVTKIIDGDSFEITNGNGEVQIMHLSHVDAPEKEQPFGRKATKYLKDLLLNKAIRFSQHDEILIDGESLNIHLLKNGYVWLAPGAQAYQLHFVYEEAQTEAMNNLRGLWLLDHELRVPPWIWRQQSTQQLPKTMHQQRAIETQRNRQADEQRKKRLEKMAEQQRQYLLKRKALLKKEQQSNDDQ